MGLDVTGAPAKQDKAFKGFYPGLCKIHIFQKNQPWITITALHQENAPYSRCGLTARTHWTGTVSPCRVCGAINPINP